MKKTVLFIILGLLGNFYSRAQDLIQYQLTVRNSDCNGTNNGQAEVNVVQSHPPYSYLWNFGNTNHSVSSLAPGNYSVTVTDSLGNDTLISITIAEKICGISPTIVFTPNGDEINDTWYISNIQYYPENEILIFNRWGQKVFHSKGVYEPWDGRDLLGVPVPDNAYYYIIYADKKDDKSIIKGSVSIVR